MTETAERPPRSGLRRVLRVVGPLFSIAVIVLAALALRDQWEAVGDAGRLPGVALMGGVLAVNAVANGLLATVWALVMRLAGNVVPAARAWWVWSSSQLARFALSGAQIVGRAVQSERYGVSGLAAGGTALVEIAWMTGIDAALVVVFVPAWLGEARSIRWLAPAALVPLAFLLLTSLAPNRLLRLAAWGLRLPGVRRVAPSRAAAAVDDLDVGRREAARITALYTANALIRLSAFLAVFAGVGGDLGAAWPRAGAAYALGQFAGRIAVISPGGIGPREGVAALVLAPSVGGGPAALVVALVRGLEIAGELAFAGVARLRLLRAGG